MITDDNWVDFIKRFFGVVATDDWVKHVAKNWNHLKNEPGCGCTYAWYRDTQEYCDEFLDMQVAKTPQNGLAEPLENNE